MSHGQDGKIAGIDDQEIELKKEVMGPFKKNMSLTGKPKLFFIQACRGHNQMVWNTKQKDLNIEVDSYTPQNEESVGDKIKTPSEADFLYSYATVEGYWAFRESNSGSWYIQILCDVIDREGDRQHLLDMLTEVNKQMTMKKFATISTYDFRLTKKL